ncbi:hypothetical protein I3842_10G085000 [Carya illinoinensis]|uniref:Glycolipid transfer protein domain-containing protein n=1 Tax=Carya illinoinensis TaxID=32201 RepID=A0A922DXW8_CARIL|nr:hypothetical protein I3842_10G085000 [Carya illinoinensis]
MAILNKEKPLRKILEALNELMATVNSQTANVELVPFSSACSLISPLFGCLGIAFRFAKGHYIAKVFAPHHGWVIRKSMAAKMYALPTKAHLLKKLNEDGTSETEKYKGVVISSNLYIDKLFLSRELGLDW